MLNIIIVLTTSITSIVMVVVFGVVAITFVLSINIVAAVVCYSYFDDDH